LYILCCLYFLLLFQLLLFVNEETKVMQIKPIGPNQTELHFSGGVVLFSYQTPVAFRSNEGITRHLYYKTSKKWSKTTSKHINAWVGDYVQEKEQDFFDNLIKQFEIEGI
jgi:hypothetical protein